MPLPAQAAVTKTPQTGCLVNDRKPFLTLLEAGGPRSGHQDCCDPVRTHFWVAGCQLVMVSSHGREQRQEAISLETFIKTLIPFMRTASSRPRLIPITSRRPRLLVPSCGEGRGFNIWFGWGNGAIKHSVYNISSTINEYHWLLTSQKKSKTQMSYVAPGERTKCHLQSCQRDGTWVWINLCIQLLNCSWTEELNSPWICNRQNPECEILLIKWPGFCKK